MLAGWHGWGAAPQLFDRPEYEADRARLEARLGEPAFQAAARTTLNAHYTDPRIVEAMWDTVGALGVTEGTVLEPGCGSGEILAAAPPGWSGVGVELDPTTAAVARARLQGTRHQVETGSFADTQLADATASAVVANVPFGNYRLHDPVHNPGRKLSIHDHFATKSLTALAPGGVGMIISSRYSLDSLDDRGRQAMGERADFLGAVRLPTVAHQGHAGTKVVTDVLVFRRRPEGEPARHAAGFLDRPQALNPAERESPNVSGYFTAHPGQVAGTMATTSGRFGPELAVTATEDWQQDLQAGLRMVVEAAPVTAPPAVEGAPVVLRGPAVEQGTPPAGHLERTDTGVFRLSTGTGWEPLPVPAARRTEVGELCRLRDGALDLVAAETNPATPGAEVEALRTDLAGRYDRYRDRYGPLNRMAYKSNGARNPDRLGGFRKDPRWPRVAALEIYDEPTGTTAPAAILTRRVVTAAAPVEHAESPADAAAIAVQQTGHLDVERIGGLLGIDADQVPAVLGDQAFTDPGTSRLITRAEYLSGNVRTKLAVAEAFAVEDPGTWGRNVEALTVVQPPPVRAEDLTGLAGAPWIPHDSIGEYVCHLAGRDGTVEVQHSQDSGKWALDAGKVIKDQLRGDHRFGTDQRSALQLLEDGLNGTQPTITRAVDEKRVPDPEATENARERLSEMLEDFDHWLLHDDPERSAELLDIYNTRFNSYVPRSYEGVTVEAPGLRADFKLRPHQHQAVARMVSGGNTLLAHPVGAGKTAEMIVGAMELRRTGAIQRPAFVVPNHMLEQFGRDIADLYPSVDALAISAEDLNARGRTAFAAKASTHDWDCVVITHNAFKAWPMSDEVIEQLQTDKVERLRTDLQAVTGQGDGRTMTKALEKRLASAEESLKASQARIRGGQDAHDLPFDRAGIDYLIVDEAHTYKTVPLTTSARNLRGVPAGPGSGIAVDLGDKLEWLRGHAGERPYVTFATGTPISNTVAEMWAMGTYLNPELLDELGIRSFDAFRGQFCETTSNMELDTSGTKFRSVERLAKYQNLPELARWWGEFADVVAVEDLDLPRPELAGGSRRTIVVEPPAGLAEFMATEVSDRAERIRSGGVDPTEDNMLKLSSDCRAASFDWAGYSGQTVDSDQSTLDQCAERIAGHYRDTQTATYRTPPGADHPRPGGFQLVFADLGTPKGDGDSAYRRLKDALVERGVPAEQVQFVHDHDQNDDAKARFFDSCRDGRTAVAISSTAKMGVGTNVQDRLVAMHHLDCPWRPSDIEQREGRILRQGNQNPEVSIYAYATERSFSVYGWQTLERKAGFIGQVMRADPDGPRSIEVTDTEALAYGEVKAIATGDPRFLEAAKLDDQLGRLERLSRAHSRDMTSAQRRIVTSQRSLDIIDHQAETLAPVAERIGALDGREFSFSAANGRNEDLITNRADAARAVEEINPYGSRPSVVGTFPAEGLTLRFEPAGISEGSYQLYDKATNTSLGNLGRAPVADRHSLKDITGAMTRISNQIDRLPGQLTDQAARRSDLTERITQARATTEIPFEHAGELAGTRTAARNLWAAIKTDYADTEPALAGDEPPGPAEVELTGAAKARQANANAPVFPRNPNRQPDQPPRRPMGERSIER